VGPPIIGFQPLIGNPNSQNPNPKQGLHAEVSQDDDAGKSSGLCRYLLQRLG